MLETIMLFFKININMLLFMVLKQHNPMLYKIHMIIKLKDLKQIHKIRDQGKDRLIQN